MTKFKIFDKEFDDEYLIKVLSVIQSRLTTLNDIYKYWYFFISPLEYREWVIKNYNRINKRLVKGNK